MVLESGRLEPTNPVARRMWQWVPPMWYARSRTALGIFEAQGGLLEQFHTDVADVASARLPDCGTTPRWGLDRLRVEVGLDEIIGESDDALCARIVARFRAWGSTIYRLRQIALAWEYGDIAILPDPEAYNLWVEFNDIRGVPADLDAHAAELRANVQAHLGINWLVTYLTWDEVRRSRVTWQQLKDAGITWEQLRSMTYQALVAIAQGGP